MSERIIEAFAGIPDRQAAEAFSEVSLRLTDMKVAAGDFPYPLENGFPPVPAVLRVMATAYRDDSGHIRRQVLPLDAEVNHLDTFEEEYAQLVGRYHETSELLPELPGENQDGLRHRAIQLAKKAGMRTVASFVLFESVEGDEIFPGLLVPRLTFQEIPLEKRDLILRELSILEEDGVDPAVFDELREGFGPLLQMADAAGELGVMAAALSLPSVDNMRQSIEAIRDTTVQESNDRDKYAGMSRDERRAAEKAERKAATRARQRENKNREA